MRIHIAVGLLLQIIQRILQLLRIFDGFFDGKARNLSFTGSPFGQEMLLSRVTLGLIGRGF